MPSFYKTIHRDKLILIIGEEGGTLVNINNSVIDRYFSKSTDDSDFLDLKSCISSHSKLPLYVVLNNLEQSYYVENIPNSSLFGINFFLKSKIKSNFNDYDLCSAFLLGQSEDIDKYSKYMFVSVKLDLTLKKWISIINELSNNFIGILLLPVELVNIIKDLRLMYNKDSEIKWDVMVSHTKTGGLRQVVLQDKKLIFSTLLSPNEESLSNIIAGNIYQEIQNTFQALIKFGLEKDDIVNLYLIVPADIKASLLTINFQQHHVNIFTPGELAKDLNLEWSTSPVDQFCDTLLLCAISQKPPVMVLHTKETRVSFYMSKLHNFLTPIFVFLSLMLVLVDVLYLINLNFDKQKNLVMQETEKELSMQLDNLNSDNDIQKINKMHDIIGIYKLISTINYSPLDQAVYIHKIINNDLRLKNFLWQFNESNNKIYIKLKFEIPSYTDRELKYENLKSTLNKVFSSYKISTKYNPSTQSKSNDATIDVEMER